MIQHWKLINLERRAGLDSLYMTERLEDFLFKPSVDRLVWMLAVPRKPKPYQRTVEKGHSTSTRDLGALNLPYDILSNIFHQITFSDTRDAVYLSLTNTYLREIGQERVYRAMFLSHGPWNLQRLICVGEFLDGDDLPQTRGVIKAHEDKILRGSMSQGQVSRRVHECYISHLRFPRGLENMDDIGRAEQASKKLREQYGRHRSRLYHTVANQSFIDRDTMARWCAEYADKRTPGLSPTERRELRALTEPDFSWDGTPETEWVLCSWTFVEYVRASAVAKLTGSSCRGPWTSECLGLAHVLLTQICWSSDASDIRVEHNTPITRGRWAGHHVAITTVDRLAEDHVYNVQGDWDDVTDEIIAEVLDLWRLNRPRTLAKGLRPERKTRREDSDDEDSSDDEDQEW